MIGGAIAARIWCELLIVLFKINEYARRIADAEPPTRIAGSASATRTPRQPAPEAAAP